MTDFDPVRFTRLLFEVRTFAESAYVSFAELESPADFASNTSIVDSHSSNCANKSLPIMSEMASYRKPGPPEF